MTNAPERDIEKGETTIIRVGGLMGFIVLGIYVIVNFILLAPAIGAGAAPEEPAAFISEHAERMVIANGLRNIISFCFLFWAAGLYALTRHSAPLASNAWGLLGLLGTMAASVMTIIANGVETTIFLNYGGVSGQSEIFLLLWSLTGILYVVPQVGVSVMAVGFSLAGWRTGTLPRWLVGLGLILAAATLLTCFGMVSLMTDGWAVMVQLVALVLILAWLLSTSVLMVRRA